MATKGLRAGLDIERAPPFAQPVLMPLRAVMHASHPGAAQNHQLGQATLDAWKSHHRPHGGLQAAERGESDDAMGRLGRITSAKNLPPQRELLRIVKQPVALGAKPAATPR